MRQLQEQIDQLLRESIERRVQRTGGGQAQPATPAALAAVKKAGGRGTPSPAPARPTTPALGNMETPKGRGRGRGGALTPGGPTPNKRPKKVFLNRNLCKS